MSVKWSGELELKLTEQKDHYQKELARAMARLKGIEYMVNTIAAAGSVQYPVYAREYDV